MLEFLDAFNIIKLWIVLGEILSWKMLVSTKDGSGPKKSKTRVRVSNFKFRGSGFQLSKIAGPGPGPMLQIPIFN